MYKTYTYDEPQKKLQGYSELENSEVYNDNYEDPIYENISEKVKKTKGMDPEGKALSFGFNGMEKDDGDNPPTKIHVVKKDETLYSLSKLYGVSIDELRKENPNIRNNKFGNPEIFEYYSNKEKPLSWEGKLPPIWYVTKIIIPGKPKEKIPVIEPTESNELFPTLNIDPPMPTWKLGLLQLGLALFIDSPHSPLYNPFYVVPGELRQNRCYYNPQFDGYFEWSIDEESELMRVDEFSDYDYIDGRWRGVNKTGSKYFGELHDGSWAEIY